MSSDKINCFLISKNSKTLNLSIGDGREGLIDDAR